MAESTRDPSVASLGAPEHQLDLCDRAAGHRNRVFGHRGRVVVVLEEEVVHEVYPSAE